MAVSGVRRPAAESEDTAFYVALYRRMLLIRRVEDLIQTLFLRGEVYGTTHLYSGQEAVAVGVASALEEGDKVACTYRGMGTRSRSGSSRSRWSPSCSGARPA